MADVLERIAAGGKTTREILRREKEKPRVGRPRSFVFQYKPASKEFSLKVSFRKSRVNLDEVTSALQATLKDLKQSKK